MAMASSATTKAARRAAREAVVAAQADLARRNRANMDDLAVFLSARQRADAVDDWFNERVAALKVQADERRAGQRRECGCALAAMRERGESIRDIARMAGIGEKTVRELIRAAGTDDGAGSASSEAVPAVLNGDNGAQGEPLAVQPPGETPAPPTGSWSSGRAEPPHGGCEFVGVGGCADDRARRRRRAARSGFHGFVGERKRATAWGSRNHYGCWWIRGCTPRSWRGSSRWWCADRAPTTARSGWARSAVTVTASRGPLPARRRVHRGGQAQGAPTAADEAQPRWGLQANRRVHQRFSGFGRSTARRVVDYSRSAPPTSLRWVIQLMTRCTCRCGPCWMREAVVANVFISHTDVDAGWADRICQWLAHDGHAVFLDHDLHDGVAAGEDWEARLYERLRWADVVVCVVTPAYAGSVWCAAEIGAARTQGSELIPVRVTTDPVEHPLLTRKQYIDVVRDQAEARERLRSRLSVIDGGGGRGWPDGTSPYPGLRPFELGEHRVFFGRGREITQIAERLRSRAERAAPAILTVVGPSGCGKSSLIRAGLLPRIAGEGTWLALSPMVPGTDPTGNLIRALAAVTRERRLPLDVTTLRQSLTRDGLKGISTDLLLAARSPERVQAVGRHRPVRGTAHPGRAV